MTERNIFPTVKPMEGVAGRTSEWRTVRPDLIEDNCIKCMQCIVHCPDDCIIIKDDGFPYIEQHYCKGCMICAGVCPKFTIFEVPVLPGGEVDDPKGVRISYANK